MTHVPPPGAHDPAAATVPDLREELDAARARCPVQHEGGTYSLLGHAEVLAAANDPETFSSAVSRHRAIPNSLDGAEHAAYREIVERYMTRAEVDAQEAQCRAHAEAIVAGLPRGERVKTLADFAVPFAVRTQLEWLGWPESLEGHLVDWMARNREATRSGEYERTAAVAAEFDAMLESILDGKDGTGEDPTSRLMRETVDGRPLTREEIVSILRNWTAGDLGSLASSLGVLVHHLANDPVVQEDMRFDAQAQDTLLLEDAILEILRIDDPFVANRRITTREVDVAGVKIPEGARVVLNWTAANRDPLVMGDPDEFRPVENLANNLVFGTGPHVCPGMALTLMELRVAISALLAGTRWIHPFDGEAPVRLEAPGSGWAQVPVVLE
ncbi:MAG: cytochrome P450 [bacterium]|nr:cytochrome P450 [bacterium]